MTNSLSFFDEYLKPLKLPSIPDALQNITSSCTDSLKRLYPAGIPDPINKRYEQEYNYLTHSEYIDDFELFRMLSREAQKSTLPISLQLSTSSSFLCYLLNTSMPDPLPVYYYCPHCGHYEEGPSHSFGIDLPQKKCPECGTEICASGFNLPPENVWGTNGQKAIEFQYKISSEFFPFAQRILKAAYPDNEIVPWGDFQINESTQKYSSYSGVTGIRQVGFIILPEGKHFNDFPSPKSTLNDGTPCIIGDFASVFDVPVKNISLIPDLHIEKIVALQRATGIYANEISINKLRTITWNEIYSTGAIKPVISTLIKNYIPRTFREMSNAMACLHNMYTWDDTDEYNINYFEIENLITSESFKKYPCYTREDFFDYLLENDTERDLAFTAAEYARKGYAALSEQPCSKFYDLSVPSEFKTVASHFRCAISRAVVINVLLTYARLAYYARLEPCKFNRVMFPVHYF